MTRYTIEPGQQNFRPLEPLAPIIGKRKFKIDFYFESSCWFSPGSWEGDNDWEDWNKLCGVTNYFSENNRQTAMIAFKPSKTKGFIRLTAYVNFKDKSWDTGGTVEIPVKTHGTAVIDWTNKRRVKFDLLGHENQFSLKRPTVMRQVGTYIGGANNSPGAYGGYATQRMELLLEMQKLR